MTAPFIRLGREICADLESASEREWLETNGLGGFATGTVAGVHTRRYHGLLVAPLRPPIGRTLLLAKLAERLIFGEQAFELDANQYPGVVHPQGYQYLEGFVLDPFPTWTYRVGDVTLTRTVFMVHGRNTTVIQYALTGAPPGAVLELRPFLAFRDYHALGHENADLDGGFRCSGGNLVFRPYAGLPELYLAHPPAQLDPAGYWFRNLEYPVERDRGLDWQEDLCSPCALRVSLDGLQRFSVIASTEPEHAGHADTYRAAELRRREAVVAASGRATDLERPLVLAADQFLVARGEHKTVIAGYPWFTDWGRDTMIALPGLALATGRPEVARDLLLEYAAHVDQGMLPNRFPDQGEAPEYNTVDATLWFFQAVRAWLEATGETALFRERLYPVLADILDWHVRGTRYGIRVDEDALLASGAEGLQLTWMDARVGDWVVTPRRGKPVEIQALWYNALRVVEEQAAALGDEPRREDSAHRAGLARESFQRQFWNPAASCLYDCLGPEGPDGSVRPNQLLALSLPHPLITGERAASVLGVVERELLTPYGLRTLSPRDPAYRGACRGNVVQRDSAYHQGTVWPWLLGAYVDAYLRHHGRCPEMSAFVRTWKKSLLDHMHEAGLGQVSEIFDGDPPHAPRGCPAQAWSVAEALRVLASLE